MLTAIPLLLYNCSEDELQEEQTIEIEELEPEISVTIIDFSEIVTNSKVLKKIERITKANSISKTTSRDTITSNEYGFSINTDYVKLIEVGDYHSYTFQIDREEDNGLFENLVISLNSEGNYDLSILSYDLTESELANLLFGNPINLSDKVTKTTIEDTSIISSLFSRTEDYCITVVTTWCGEGNHSGGWDENGAACPAHESSSETICTGGGGGTSGPSGGGDNGNDGSDTSDPTTGGNGGEGGPSSNNNTPNSGVNEVDPYYTAPTCSDCLSLEETIAAEIEIINSDYSNASPFDVDMTDILEEILLPDSNENDAAEKFNCLFEKLSQSIKYKDLFIDIFGDSKAINATFKIVDSLPSNSGNGEAAGNCTLRTYTINQNGTINTANVIIKINKKILINDLNHSNIEIVKTILHESIHAYLKIKLLDSNCGLTLQELNNLEFQELIAEYYDGSCATLQEQHEFMIDYMIPTMQIILSEIRDNIIPQSQQNYVEQNPFFDYNNNIFHPWNWTELYYYMSLSGLHLTETFNEEISTDPYENYLYNQYNLQVRNFSKTCLD